MQQIVQQAKRQWSNSNKLWFFSDEKNFCADQKFKKQNNQWIAMNPADVPKVIKTKYPETVTVFGVISDEGVVMPPCIFEKGLRVNSEIYIQVLEEKIFPWIQGVAGDRPWVWQQDSAPATIQQEQQSGSKIIVITVRSPNPTLISTGATLKER